MLNLGPHWLREPPALLRYGIAFLSTAGVILVELRIQTGATVSLLLGVFMFSAWFGGVGPGLLAGAISILGFKYFFIQPIYSLAIHADQLSRLSLFVLVVFFIGFLVIAQRSAAELLRDARDDLQKTNRALQAENIERKRREDTLREQAQLLDLTHDTVFVRDMSDTITYWNRGAAEQYGFMKEEAVGQSSHLLMQTVFPAPLAEINAELLRVGRWEGELVHTKRDGTRVVVASRWALQRGEHGNPIAVLETNNDITERKRAEAELKQIEQRLGTIVASTPIVLFALDRSGVFVLSEGKALDTLGVKAGQVVGQSVFDVYQDVPEILSNVRRALAGAASTEVVEVNELIFETHYVPFLDHHGGVAGVNGVAIDITARMRAEEALREARSRASTRQSGHNDGTTGRLDCP